MSDVTNNSGPNSDTKSGRSSSISSSPAPICTICLDPITSEVKCFAYSCLHQFCFPCLLKWSEIKTECPLCKRKFNKILHNIVSPRTYNEYIPQSNQPSSSSFINVPQLQEQIHLNRVRLLFGYDSDSVRLFAELHQDEDFPLRTTNNGIPWRKICYCRDLYARNNLDEPHIDLNYSAEFYQNQPLLLDVMYEWLTRELTALHDICTTPTLPAIETIKNNLTIYNIESIEFVEALPLLQPFTVHFLYELKTFARSIHNYSVEAFDANVLYDYFYPDGSSIRTGLTDISASDSSIATYIPTTIDIAAYVPINTSYNFGDANSSISILSIPSSNTDFLNIRSSTPIELFSPTERTSVSSLTPSSSLSLFSGSTTGSSTITPSDDDD